MSATFQIPVSSQIAWEWILPAPCEHHASTMSARKHPLFSQTRCTHGAGMVLASETSKLLSALSGLEAKLVLKGDYLSCPAYN
ncbi:hypothetical protein [Chryseosolibacter indicus]|nr:hypothetical protein [Chryseosolibacter indicus]